MLELNKNIIDRLKPHVNNESIFKEHLPTVDINAFCSYSINKKKASWVVKGFHKEKEILKTGITDCEYWFRAQMFGVLQGLNIVRIPSNIRLYSDCAIVINAYAGDLVSDWKLNGWRKKSGGGVQNRDLWAGIEKNLMYHNVVFKKASASFSKKYTELAKENLNKQPDKI